MALITKDDLSQIETNIEDKKVHIANLEADLDSVTNEIADHNQALAKSIDQLAKIESDIVTTTKAIDNATAIIQANTDKIASNEALLKQYDGELAAAESAGDDAEVKRLLQLIADLNAENKALITEKDDQVLIKSDSEAELETHNKVKIEVENEQQSIKTSITAANTKYNNIKAELITVQEELAALESSTLLKEYEKQVETRKEHAKGTIKNKERIKVLLRDQNATVEDKLTEFNSDSKIFIDDIKAELEFTPEAESKLERVQSELDEQGTMFSASNAFKLSSQSVYDIKEIVEKIKKACYKGETSISIELGEISGTQILMLDKAGYKITHSKSGGRLDNDTEILTIDWGFVQAS